MYPNNNEKKRKLEPENSKPNYRNERRPAFFNPENTPLATIKRRRLSEERRASFVKETFKPLNIEADAPHTDYTILTPRLDITKNINPGVQHTYFFHLLSRTKKGKPIALYQDTEGKSYLSMLGGEANKNNLMHNKYQFVISYHKDLKQIKLRMGCNGHYYIGINEQEALALYRQAQKEKFIKQNPDIAITSESQYIDMKLTKDEIEKIDLGSVKTDDIIVAGDFYCKEKVQVISIQSGCFQTDIDDPKVLEALSCFTIFGGLKVIDYTQGEKLTKLCDQEANLRKEIQDGNPTHEQAAQLQDLEAEQQAILNKATITIADWNGIENQENKPILENDVLEPNPTPSLKTPIKP